MNKAHILAEIKRTAAENNGIPLGIDRFFETTGIRKEDWYGIYWAKWSDAQREAGLEPNQFGEAALEEDFMLVKLAEFTRELGGLPAKSQMQLRKRQDSEFPNVVTLQRRLGNKDSMVRRIHEYCSAHENWTDVAKICAAYLDKLPEPEDESDAKDAGNLVAGHVYLLRHHKEYKIGRSTDAARRHKEIRIQMPYETEEIHIIETDDTVGIEAYWHNRFSSKRLKGEWFALDASDIRAFKKRKFM
jgi:hypothetical protein